MRNYWLDKKMDLVSRKITLDKVTGNTDLFKMGRIMTEKHEMLWPLTYMSGDHGLIYVPEAGADVLVIDEKYYIGNSPAFAEMTPDEADEVSMQGWVEFHS